MKERSLVFFTLLMQGATGLCCLGYVSGAVGIWLIALILAVSGMTASFFHLKVPLHAWRALSNLKSSWLSREILCASLFIFFLFVVNLFMQIQVNPEIIRILQLMSVFFGAAMVFCMGSAYRLKTVRFWDSMQTLWSFYISCVALGLSLMMIYGFFSNESKGTITFYQGSGFLALLILSNLYFSIMGIQRMNPLKINDYMQLRKIVQVRVVIGLSAVVISMFLIFSRASLESWIILPFVVIAVVSEFYGRVLFYAAQVPYGVYLLNE